jgi:hypothetical protein
MIVKELDPFSSTDAFARAGRAAEEQMAHYLRRAFATDPDIAVFNGLRIERDQDAAQMDHVILHRYGLIIVESKSVTSQLRVNEQGEWIRYYGRTAKGMPSPILQAERQADFLRTYLQRHPEALAGTSLAINVRVAISDTGVIQRAKSLELDRVLKADQIPGNVRETIRARRTMQALPKFMAQVIASAAGGTVASPLGAEGFGRLRDFLLAHHRPLRNSIDVRVRPSIESARQPVTTRHQASPAVPVCGHCGSTALSVEYGYSYYFKCLACKGSTTIQHMCNTCGRQERTRKVGQQFFRACQHCGTSVLFHTNGAT